MKKILNYAAIGLMALSSVLVSCNPNDGNTDNPEKPVEGAEGTFVIASEKGSTATLSITTGDSWVVSKRATWFSVDPTKGQAGQQDLTVTAEQANEELEERITTFTLIINDGTSKPFYVVQRGVVSTVLSEADRFVLAGDQELTIPFYGTYAFADMNVSTDAEWLTFSQIVTTKEPELLMDSLTRSAYAEGNIVLTVNEANSEAVSRKAKITVEAGEQTFEINVFQQSEEAIVADFSKDFYKRAVFFKATGSWCGFCPQMTKALDIAQEAYPDRSYVASLYAQTGQEPSVLACGSDGVNLLRTLGFGGTYPTSYLNGYLGIPLMNNNNDYTITYNMCKDALKEAVTSEEYKAEVAIAAASKVDKGFIDLTINFASKVDKSFKYVVIVMEDGIMYSQSDNTKIVEDPNNYEHNHVVKSFANKGFEDGGEVITLSANQVTTKKLSFLIPDKVSDPDKVQILIYVTSDGTYKVENVLYADYFDCGWIIDNALQIPVRGFADFKYEE